MIKCKCGTEYEGNFCPNCGEKACNDTENCQENLSVDTVSPEQKKKNRNMKWLLGGVIVIIVIVAFIAANPNSGTHEQRKQSNKLQGKLSETVTDDWLPGTYVTEDGKIFGISVYDEEIFNINVTLANAFQGKDWTSCSVVLPDYVGWEEQATLDLGEKSIELLGTDLVYSYELNGKQLTLTTPMGEKFLCQKVSDEYNADILKDFVEVSMEDIVGLYEGEKGIVQIEKQSSDSVNIYCCRKETGTAQSYYILGAAEQVPLEVFEKNTYVCLVGEDACDTRFITFENREKIFVEGDRGGYFRMNEPENIEVVINIYKEKHPDVNCQYSAYSDDIDILESTVYEQIFSFNKKWYTQYTCFLADNGAKLDIKSQEDDTIHIQINGSDYRTFKASNYTAGNNFDYVVYTCEDGSKFEYFPEYNDSLTGVDNYVPRIFFAQMDEGVVEESYYVENGMDFKCRALPNTTIDKNNEEEDDDERTAFEDNSLWFHDYSSFYRVREFGDLSVYTQADTVLYVSFSIDGEEDQGWLLDLEPNETGADGELIYYGEGDFELVYYPSDHHILIETTNGRYSGEYWPY